MNQQNDVKNLQNIIKTSIDTSVSQFDTDVTDVYLPDGYLDYLDPDYAVRERYALTQKGNYEALANFNHYFGLVYNNLQQRIEEYRLMKNLDPYYVNDCVLQIRASYERELIVYYQQKFQLEQQYAAGLIDGDTFMKRNMKMLHNCY